MEFSLKQALKVLVVFACAVGVVGTSVMITNKNTDNAKNKNDSLWNVVNGSDSDSDDSNTPTSGPNGEPLVSKTESQVGKYADIDGDGTVDGIIFADLMVGGSGIWTNRSNSNTDWGSYTISTITSSKEYYVSQESYTNDLGGNAEVLTPVGNGNDRFYVMALNDANPEGYEWYSTAYSLYTNPNGIKDYNTVTNVEFGTGRQNTLNMIEKWNNSAYGEQSPNDLWGQIKNEVNNGWFVPSRAELAAFGANLGVTSSNYKSKGLNHYYWTSSLLNTYSSYVAYFTNSYMSNWGIDKDRYVRLAITF